MSISSIFGTPILLTPKPSQTLNYGNINTKPNLMGMNNKGGLMIECSSRPKKKATAHHMKTRPKKRQAWDINRKPTVYAPLPPLPPDWTFVSSASEQVDVEPTSVLDSAPDLPPPLSTA